MLLEGFVIYLVSYFSATLRVPGGNKCAVAMLLLFLPLRACHVLPQTWAGCNIFDTWAILEVIKESIVLFCKQTPYAKDSFGFLAAIILQPNCIPLRVLTGGLNKCGLLSSSKGTSTRDFSSVGMHSCQHTLEFFWLISKNEFPFPACGPAQIHSFIIKSCT